MAHHLIVYSDRCSSSELLPCWVAMYDFVLDSSTHAGTSFSPGVMMQTYDAPSPAVEAVLSWTLRRIKNSIIKDVCCYSDAATEYSVHCHRMG
jgi:hypothetical protein